LQVINLESVIRDVESRGIDGAFVETGTYTGGASAYALRALLRLRGEAPRDYWGFDSFEGMPAPTAEDGDHGSYWIYNKPMDKQLVRTRPELLKGHDVNRADYGKCLSFLQATGYPWEKLHLIKGWFQDTLPKCSGDIGPIAILRLDGDFYESTKVVLEALYEQVAPGGSIIIDDYGAFQGCRKATDEFLLSRRVNIHLIYVENGIRYFVKP
jgi:O-methyltransferase